MLKSRLRPSVRASVSEVMLLLANDLRVEALAAIARTDKCVSEIADELEIDLPAASRLLKQLAASGLVVQTPVQNRHFYHLSDAVEVVPHDHMVRVAVSAAGGERVRVVKRVH